MSQVCFYKEIQLETNRFKHIKSVIPNSINSSLLTTKPQQTKEVGVFLIENAVARRRPLILPLVSPAGRHFQLSSKISQHVLD